jgi:hypothetical protein
VFVQASGAAALPTSFAVAEMCFRQQHLMNGGDELARRCDMNTMALSYPLKYFQQTTFRTTVNATANTDVQINLTGFRSGSLKSIDVWAAKTADIAAGKAYKWELLGNVRLLINGLVYYDSRAASNQIWSLLDAKTSRSFNNSTVDASGSSIVAAGSSVAPWLNIPFAPHSEVLAGDTVVTTGVSMLNSVANLVLQTSSTAEYLISCSYNYASSLLFSRGGAEYIY